MNPLLELFIVVTAIPCIVYPWFKLMHALWLYDKKIGLKLWSAFWFKENQLPVRFPETEREQLINEIWKRVAYAFVGFVSLFLIIKIVELFD